MNLGERSKRRAAASAAIIAALALVVAGCSNSANDSNSANVSNSDAGSSSSGPALGIDKSITEPPPALKVGNPDPSICKGKQYTIGFDVYSATEGFAVENTKNFKDLAASLGCVKPIVLVDNADPATVTQNINSFVQQHVDGVVLAQVVAAAQPGVVRTLTAAKIPVVAAYVAAPGSPFIDVDNAAAGLSGGVAVGQEFAKRYPGVKPYVVIGAFPEGGVVSVARMDGVVKGVQSVIPGIPESQILKVDTKADPAQANSGTTNVLQRLPKDAHIIYSGINDLNTYAMLQAIRAAHRESTSVGMGMGGDPSGRKFICANQPSYFGTVGFFPDKYFQFLLPGIIGMANGVGMPARVVLPTQILTAATMKQYYPDDAPC
jgi:ribose transport system substrate-binding protein